MKVLLLIESLSAGGKERRLVELLKGLSLYKEIDFELAILDNKIHYSDIFNLGVKIHYLNRKKKKDPKIIFKLYNICKYVKPDIMHCWGSILAIYTAPVAKLLNIKLINSMITDAPEKIKILSKRWLHKHCSFPFSDIIVSNSKAGLIAYNAPSYKSICIHNGFNFNRIVNIKDKEFIKNFFGIEKEKKIVGMVGSFFDNKDYETYILAAQNILSRTNNVIFLAIGGGKRLNYFKSIVTSKYKDKIIFLGEQKDVESIINIFDIGVLATYTEGLSNSIMEYMAFAKPVVATIGGGTEELVIDGVTGFAVKSRDVENLTHKINYFLDNNDIAEEMGKNGKDYLETHFSFDSMVKKTFDIYSQLSRKGIGDSFE